MDLWGWGGWFLGKSAKRRNGDFERFEDPYLQKDP